ncbi:MAG: glutaredoxin domain-containing protein [Burkholderiaceae bacterium]
MSTRAATLYRMVTDEHICPYGIKSKALLERQGFEVDDRHLATREQTDQFMREHGVSTTPQTFIDGSRIGGYDDLLAHFGQTTPDDESASYSPIIAIFSMTALMSLAAAWATGRLAPLLLLEWFIAFSMCVLAIQKLRDLEGFTNQFITYDLLGMRWVRYAYFYPFGEAVAGVLMISGAGIWLAAPIALLIGSIGAVSVIKAVYVDKRELKCACVGGDSKVPLGFISLTENLMMVALAIWMVARPT